MRCPSGLWHMVPSHSEPNLHQDAVCRWLVVYYSGACTCERPATVVEEACTSPVPNVISTIQRWERHAERRRKGRGGRGEGEKGGRRGAYAGATRSSRLIFTNHAELMKTEPPPLRLQSAVVMANIFPQNFLSLIVFAYWTNNLNKWK